jgi:hypothetical protein
MPHELVTTAKSRRQANFAEIYSLGAVQHMPAPLTQPRLQAHSTAKIRNETSQHLCNEGSIGDIHAWLRSPVPTLDCEFSVSPLLDNIPIA